MQFGTQSSPVAILAPAVCWLGVWHRGYYLIQPSNYIRWPSGAPVVMWSGASWALWYFPSLENKFKHLKIHKLLSFLIIYSKPLMLQYIYICFSIAGQLQTIIQNRKLPLKRSHLLNIKLTAKEHWERSRSWHGLNMKM